MVLPTFKFAHEVYVLTPSQITGDKHHHQDFFADLHSAHNVKLLLAYSVATLAVMALLVWLKTKRPLQKLGQMIDKAGRFAPDIIRVVFGLSLILSAKHNALFGPELPLSSFPQGAFIKWALYIFGSLLILGLATRIISILAIVVYVAAFWSRGWYMLTYINYFGEALALVLVPFQAFSVDGLINRFRRLPGKFTKPNFALPATRIFFGFSLLYAAINIKVLNPSVSLDVVQRYRLTDYFHFDPIMIVFGAAMVEILIAVLYMAGLLQRVNTVVFITFITLSLFYFKESVWPHYMLIGLAIGIFLDKPDRFSLDRRLFKNK